MEIRDEWDEKTLTMRVRVDCFTEEDVKQALEMLPRDAVGWATISERGSIPASIGPITSHTCPADPGEEPDKGK